jgi:DNA primase small subunit
MSDFPYLKRLFQAYYTEKRADIPLVNMFENREFGFLSWDEKAYMKRHMSFKTHESLTKHLIDTGPRHLYSSGALYLQPDNIDMDNKEYQGCDLIIDIDVDHFYTPCKDKHDLWWCKECNASGTGMIKKCPKCKKLKIKTLTWICEDCLEIAKNEINKLIFDFLIPDFNMEKKDMRIAFSGHRGYHLKIENKMIRKLTSEDRREIADYVSGDNISLEILGLSEESSGIYGLIKENIGWPKKIVSKIEEVVKHKSNTEIQDLLERIGLKANTIKSFINYKNDFLTVLSNKNNNLWSIEGFGLKTWETFLKGIIGEIGAEIDEPVTIDTHRLIRYPGSLHGKSGFKAQELALDELDKFNPLNEKNEKLDPIVFHSKKLHNLEIIEQLVPETKIKGEKYGPYKLGEKIEVPHHIAVFLLCKGVAKTI